MSTGNNENPPRIQEGGANNCERAIREVLDQMGFEYQYPEQLTKQWNECLKTLWSLGAECSDAFTRIAKELLNRITGLEWKDEYQLWMLLEAIASRRQPNALDLTMAALVDQKTRNKEAYIDILDRLENRRAVPVLIHFIESNSTETDAEGWARYKAVRALLRFEARQAATVILPLLSDPVDKVRNIVIKFLIDLDVREAAPALAARLSEEDDPDNFEKLVTCLVR